MGINRHLMHTKGYHLEVSNNGIHFKQVDGYLESQPCGYSRGKWTDKKVTIAVNNFVIENPNYKWVRLITVFVNGNDSLIITDSTE